MIVHLQPKRDRERLEALHFLLEGVANEVDAKRLHPKTVVRFRIEAGGVRGMAEAVAVAIRTMKEHEVE